MHGVIRGRKGLDSGLAQAIDNGFHFDVLTALAKHGNR
jgi:hypothetical protein